MTQPGLADVIRQKMAEAGRPGARATEREIERAMVEVWESHGRPEYIEIYGRVFRWREELEELEHVCTPAGLRRLFPDLR